jgi:isopenicillin N synthase-like dioxygenase
LRLLRAYALCLSLPEHFFTQYHRLNEKSGSTLRFLYYPPPSDSDGQVTRAGGHTDFGSLTLLFLEPSLDEEKGEAVSVDREPKQALARAIDVNDVLEETFNEPRDGLEIMLDGKFVPVVKLPSHILVNTGDLMEYWTSGVLKSTVHRVVLPSQMEPGSLTDIQAVKPRYINLKLGTR